MENSVRKDAQPFADENDGAQVPGKPPKVVIIERSIKMKNVFKDGEAPLRYVEHRSRHRL